MREEHQHAAAHEHEGEQIPRERRVVDHSLVRGPTGHVRAEHHHAAAHQHEDEHIPQEGRVFECRFNRPIKS